MSLHKAFFRKKQNELQLEQTVNWLIVISDILFASIATILSILGLSTSKAIRHLGIGKSFWIPVFLSSILFLVGSSARIFHNVAVGTYSSPMTINTDQIVDISWVLALCLLTCSIYNYSRKVKTEALTHYFEIDSESQPQLLREPKGEKKTKKKLPVKGEKDKGIPVCPHHLGYLAQIPKDASMPEECLTCPQMLECKNVSILRAR